MFRTAMLAGEVLLRRELESPYGDAQGFSRELGASVRRPPGSYKGIERHCPDVFLEHPRSRGRCHETCDAACCVSVIESAQNSKIVSDEIGPALNRGRVSICTLTYRLHPKA